MRMVADKWAKFGVLARHDGVSKHLPATKPYSRQNLIQMLEQYGYIVAKPQVGTGGMGIIMVEKEAGGYKYQHYGTVKRAATLEALMTAIDRIRRGRKYLVQQGIRLATIQGRRVDYRVKLVKTGSVWQIRAVVAKVARPGLFVTNICRGGTLIGGRDALRRTFPNQVKGKKDTLTGVAKTSTVLLEARYPGIKELGYDFGIDRKGDIWMLEVNTRPS